MYCFQGFIQILSFQAGNFSPGNTRIFPYKSNMFIGFSITAVKRFSDYGTFVHRLPQGLDLIRAAFRTQKNRSLNAPHQRIRKCANQKLITPHLKQFIGYNNKYKTEKLTDSDIDIVMNTRVAVITDVQSHF